MSVKNPSVRIVKDGYSDISDVLLYAKITENYTVSSGNITIKANKFQDLKDYISKHYPSTTYKVFPSNKVYESCVFETEEFLIVGESLNAKKQYGFDIYAVNYNILEELYNLLKKLEDKTADTYIGIYSYYLDGKDIKDNYVTKQVDDFDKLKNSYYPYLDVKELFDQFLMSEDSMLVLTGLPGTGKTKIIDMFLEHLLTSSVVKEKIDLEKSIAKEKAINKHNKHNNKELIEVDDESLLLMIENRIDDMFDDDQIPVAYIKNEDILSLDSFWNRLLNDEPKLVILDDLDFALLPRTQSTNTSDDQIKNKFISQLLSFTDGIFESGNNTKFIITTNREVNDIDSAVLRKGRTFDILNLRYLKNHEAKNIWVNEYNLNEKEFNEIFGGIESIPASDIGSSAKDKLMAKTLERNTKSYILEEGISLYKDFKSPKKIGIV